MKPPRLFIVIFISGSIAIPTLLSGVHTFLFVIIFVIIFVDNTLARPRSCSAFVAALAGLRSSIATSCELRLGVVVAGNELGGLVFASRLFLTSLQLSLLLSGAFLATDRPSVPEALVLRLLGRSPPSESTTPTLRMVKSLLLRT